MEYQNTNTAWRFTRRGWLHVNHDAAGRQDCLISERSMLHGTILIEPYPNRLHVWCHQEKSPRLSVNSRHSCFQVRGHGFRLIDGLRSASISSVASYLHFHATENIIPIIKVANPTAINWHISLTIRKCPLICGECTVPTRFRRWVAGGEWVGGGQTTDFALSQWTPAW